MRLWVGGFTFNKGNYENKRNHHFCGKQVTLAYCYATEIIYKDIAGEDLD